MEYHQSFFQREVDVTEPQAEWVCWERQSCFRDVFHGRLPGKREGQCGADRRVATELLSQMPVELSSSKINV